MFQGSTTRLCNVLLFCPLRSPSPSPPHSKGSPKVFQNGFLTSAMGRCHGEVRGTSRSKYFISLPGPQAPAWVREEPPPSQQRGHCLRLISLLMKQQREGRGESAATTPTRRGIRGEPDTGRHSPTCPHDEAEQPRGLGGAPGPRNPGVLGCGRCQQK